MRRPDGWPILAPLSGVRPFYLSKLPIAQPPLNVSSWPRSQRHLLDDARRSTQAGDNSLTAQKIKTFYLVVGATVLTGSVTFAQNRKPGKLKM
jgi:hypothetical protein